MIDAEANIQQSNLADAVTALNVIRSAHNLPSYSGPMDQADLPDANPPFFLYCPSA